MAEEWTGRIVGMLHTHRVTQAELAAELGVTAVYVSMVLNGKKSPKGMADRMEAAVKAIARRRNANAGA